MWFPFSVKQSRKERPRVESLEDRTGPSFLASVGYAVGAYTVGVASGDLNADGKLDLATSTPTASSG
jgi:hypothetical protein